MKAEDFYNELGEKKDFTKLTKTGISTNYDNVFAFAEAYHKSQTPDSNNEFATICPKCETKTEVAIDGHAACLNCGNHWWVN